MRPVAILLATLGFCLPGETSAGAADTPNILWLTSEDHGPHLGCYGDQLATTPNLDAFAANGMMYTNAIASAPVCAPARTAIITGMYPPSLGAEHMRSLVRLPANFRMAPQFLREVGYYATNNSKEDYNVEKPGRVWDESSRTAHWKNRAKGQPFFAVFNHTITHESQLRNSIAEEHAKHDPARVRVPAYHPDTKEVRSDWARYYDRIAMMDAEAGAKLNELADAGLANDTIVFFYSDHGSGMPRSKRSLKNSGLHVPLIVYFPDRWRHLAPKDYRPGGTSARLISFIDLAPTLLSLAGVEPPQWMQGRAFAGQYETEEPEFSFAFRGRMDERYDMVRAVRSKRFFYVRNYMPHRPEGQHVNYMFQTRTTRVWNELYRDGKLDEAQAAYWKPRAVEELYDLESDPDEVRNLADSGEHSEVLGQMRRAHRDWSARIRDVGYLHEWEVQKRSRGSTPYEIGQNPDRYNFEAIFSAAELAMSLDPSHSRELSELAGHDDSGVRYWAALGLLARGKAGFDIAREQLLRALEDPSPVVRITAAEAVGRHGSEDDAAHALNVLLEYADPSQAPTLILAAWNAIDYLDGRAGQGASKIRALSPIPEQQPTRWGDYPSLVKRRTLDELMLRNPNVN
jgi:uncharacterized sulfatase